MTFIEFALFAIIFFMIFLFVSIFMIREYCKKLHVQFNLLARHVDRHEIALEMEDLLPLPWEKYEEEDASKDNLKTDKGNVIYLRRED